MPELPNKNHELLAKLVANGMKPAIAWREVFPRATVNGSGSASSRCLAQRPEIRARIEELRGKPLDVPTTPAEQRMMTDTIVRTKAKIALTKSWITDMLVENALRSMQAVPVKDAKGVETGEFKHEPMAAIRALELLGKEIGMFDSKRAVDINVQFKNMSREQLREYIKQTSAELGYEVRGLPSPDLPPDTIDGETGEIIN
jgi:hypothetical protein